VPIPDPMGPISPELALVDGPLADAARRLLPPPGNCLAPRPRPFVASTPRGPELDPAAPSLTEPTSSVRVSRARPSLIIVVAVLLVAGVVGSPGMELVRSSSSSGALVSVGPRATSSAQLRSRGGTMAHLSWTPVSGALSYELELRENRRLVLLLRPLASHVAIPLGTPTGGQSLASGSYGWTVSPVLRNRGGLRVGRPSSHGTLRVP